MTNTGTHFVVELGEDHEHDHSTARKAAKSE